MAEPFLNTPESDIYQQIIFKERLKQPIFELLNNKSLSRLMYFLGVRFKSFSAFVLAVISAERRKLKFTSTSINFTSLESSLVVLLRRCIGVVRLLIGDCATSVLQCKSHFSLVVLLGEQ